MATVEPASLQQIINIVYYVIITHRTGESYSNGYENCSLYPYI